MNKIQRTTNLTLRAEEQSNENEMRVSGYALKFDEPTMINSWGGAFEERIDKNALKDADLSNVVLNLNHNMDKTLARTKNESLDLEVDDIGLKINGNIINTTEGKDAYEMVVSGLIDQMSFQAEIIEDEWEESDGVSKRIIKKLGRFFDVSAVTFPAYENTEILAQRDADSLLKEHFKRSENMEENKINEIEKEETNKENKVDENDNEKEIEDLKSEVEELKKEIEDLKNNKEKEVDKEENEDQPKNEEIKRNEPVLMRGAMESKMENKKSIYDTVEYRNAWFEDIRHGDKNMTMSRALSTKKGSGEVLVPTMTINAIETAVRNGGKISKLCKITNIDEILSLPIELNATGAELGVEDGTAPTEETITFGEILIKPQLIHKWITITVELEAMSIDAFAQYLTEEMIDKCLTKLDSQILIGAQTDGVKGITTASADYVTSEVVTDFSTAGFDADATIKTTTPSIVVMNKSFFNKEIRKLKTTDGQLLYSGINEAGKKVYYYCDMQVELVDMPELASSKDDTTKPAFICGDFKSYWLNMPVKGGVSMIRDELSLAEKGLIKYNANLLAGGSVTKLKSFYVAKLA